MSHSGPTSTPREGESSGMSRGRLACVPCRQRKTRCPGPVDDVLEQPCGRCSRLSIRCHWRERQGAKHGKRPRSTSPRRSPRSSTATTNDAMVQSPSVALHDLQVMVELYFRTIHFLGCANFIHQPSFMRLLQMNKAPKDLTSAMVACTMRFAREPTAASLERADAINAQVVDSLHKSMNSMFGAIDLMTVTMVRTYEHARGTSTSQWMLWGYAVRMMQYLSLHTLDQTYASSKLPSNPLLRGEALRRLAWYVLYQDTMNDAGIHGDHLVNESSYSIQLPCDDVSFEAGIEVQTGPLSLGTTDVFCPPTAGSAMAPCMSLSSHLIRIALCRRRILHFNSSIEASTDSSDVLLAKLKTIQDAVTEVIVSLPPDFTYSKYNMVRHDPARPSFIHLHMLRHNCFLMLSLARINIANKHRQPESTIVSSRQDRIKHALAVSRIMGDVIGQTVLAELCISSQAYSCVEILLFDPRKLAQNGVPINPSDPVYMSALKPLMEQLRRESTKHRFIAFLRAEACHRLSHCGLEALVNEADQESLRSLDFTPSTFPIPHSDRLQVNDVDQEFNFRHTKFHLPENQGVSPRSGKGWILGKNDPLSHESAQVDDACTPTGVDAADTMVENDAATVASKVITGPAPDFLFPDFQSSESLDGITDAWSVIFGKESGNPGQDPLNDFQWMMNM